MIPVHVLHKNKSAVRRQFDLLVQCTVLRTAHQESLCIWEEKSQANLFVPVFFLAKFCCLYSFWWNLLHLSIWNVICLEVSFFGGASHSRLLSFSAVSDARNFIGYWASLSFPRRSTFYLIYLTYQSPHHDSSEVCHKTGDNYSRPAAEDRE